MENHLNPILVLDFDGVLVHLDINWVHVRHEVSKALGIEISSLNVFWEKYFGTKNFKDASDIVEKYELEALERAEPMENVAAALALWQGKRYIASLQSGTVLKLFVEKHGLKAYISEILDRTNFGSKRNQLKYILLKEGIKSKCIVIDDSKINQKMCSELGLQCILFNINKDKISDIVNKFRA